MMCIITLITLITLITNDPGAQAEAEREVHPHS